MDTMPAWYKLTTIHIQIFEYIDVWDSLRGSIQLVFNWYLIGIITTIACIV